MQACKVFIFWPDMCQALQTGTKIKMGDQAFWVAGPHTWNSLPETIQETKTKIFLLSKNS